jgi:hypothetical protein
LETKGLRLLKTILKLNLRANKGYQNIVAGQRGEIELKAITNRASISGNTLAYVLPEIN